MTVSGFKERLRALALESVVCDCQGPSGAKAGHACGLHKNRNMGIPWGDVEDLLYRHRVAQGRIARALAQLS